MLKVLLFICYYLMVGLGIQLFLRMAFSKTVSEAETMKQTMDVVDYALFDDTSQSNSVEEADEFLNSKLVLIINVLVWPLNIAIGAYILIKLKWPFRK